MSWSNASLNWRGLKMATSEQLNKRLDKIAEEKSTTLENHHSMARLVLAAIREKHNNTGSTECKKRLVERIKQDRNLS